MMHTCTRIIRARNGNAFRSFIADRFGVDVGPNHAARWMDTAWEAMIRWHCYYPDDDWGMWIANRLRESGFGWLFRGHRHQDSGGVGTCTLHVGFIRIEETPDHTARLPEESAVRSTLATSRIARTALVLVPIDRVAARVIKVEALP